jgi:hypothetical protein
MENSPTVPTSRLVDHSSKSFLMIGASYDLTLFNSGTSPTPALPPVEYGELSGTWQHGAGGPRFDPTQHYCVGMYFTFSIPGELLYFLRGAPRWQVIK